MNPDGVRDYDVAVPLSAAKLTSERHAGERDRWLAEAEEWRDDLRRELGTPAGASLDDPRGVAADAQARVPPR